MSRRKLVDIHTMIPKRHDEDFTRTIEVLFTIDGVEFRRIGRALFDSGSPWNVISLSFGRLFGYNLDRNTTEAKLRLAGGNEIRSIAKVEGRFSPVHNEVVKNQQLWFDPKFMPASFHFSAEDEPFDIVIGSETITEEGLMEFKHPLGFSGFGLQGYQQKAPSTSNPAVQPLSPSTKRTWLGMLPIKKPMRLLMEENRPSQQAAAAAAAEQTRAGAQAVAEATHRY